MLGLYLFHVHLLILLKVFKAMSANETEKIVTCRKTGSFLNQEANCDLLHEDIGLQTQVLINPEVHTTWLSGCAGLVFIPCTPLDTFKRF